MRRIILGFAVVAMVLGGFASPAGAAHAPTITLRYTTALQDGQKDPVRGRHWTPGSVVDATQCTMSYPTAGLDACNGPVATFASDTGKVRTKVFVRTGSTGTLGEFCETTCLIVLYERDNPNVSAYEQFTFAA